MTDQVRIYYVGGDNDHVDERLPGLILNYGNAVDVGGPDLAEELLKLRHFSKTIIPAQVVEDTKHEVVKVRRRRTTRTEAEGVPADETE